MSELHQQSIVTKVERQQRSQKRYNVYVDHQYAFSVHEDTLVSWRILPGKPISVDEWESILFEDEKKKAESKGLKYLAFRPRTTYEMNVFLKEKGYNPELVDELLAKWEKEGYLNDQLFAEQWFHERLSNQLKGPLLLKEELRKKGIPEHLVERALHTLDADLENIACRKLARKKWAKLTSVPNLERRKYKLMAYLQRRGFRYETINVVVEELQES